MSVIDPRDRELARLLVGYSVAAKKGDLVFIECVGQDTLPLGAAIVEEVAKAGAAPHLQLTDLAVQRTYMSTAGEESMARLGAFERVMMENTQCFIGIRGADNIFEKSDVPVDKARLFNKLVYQPVHLDIRVNKTRWCVLRYPNPSMAQLAQKSTPAFADFYYKVCCTDYEKMAAACEPLADLMRRTDRVEIVGPNGTNLSFSIKNIPPIPCCGTKNIPDGECFTAPVRDSMNGTVQYNTPSVYDGQPFDNPFLRFENGKVVEARAATAAQTKALNEILDRDEGARYLGEFAIAFNPFVREPMRDILFDEKIAGSFHMALGNAYDEATNGNKSGIHWDMVCIQRPDYGGGEIRFDGVLVRKDGLFVLPELKGLNPDAFQ